MTTDSYVIRPLFFPGGDIGKLAVYGSVNDLAMCGARAAWLSVGLILEEGLSMEVLRRVLASTRLDQVLPMYSSLEEARVAARNATRAID